MAIEVDDRANAQVHSKSTPHCVFNSSRGVRNFRGGFNPPTPPSNTALRHCVLQTRTVVLRRHENQHIFTARRFVLLADQQTLQAAATLLHSYRLTYVIAIITLIIADALAGKVRQSVASVRRLVSILSFEPTDLWP